MSQTISRRLLGGAIALLGVASCAEKTPEPAPYAPRVQVAVTGDGFVPNTIRGKVGTPLTLMITRKADTTCATEILFEGQEGKTDLPLGKTVEVSYQPKAAGRTKFGCAMGMMVGGVIVAE